MATYKDVMRWVAELDVTKAVRGFKDLEREGKKSLDAVGDEADNIEDKFGGLGDKFKGVGGKLGGAMASGFAALGVGALMVSALEKSWERAGGIRKITGQFRLSADEAAKYGKVAGELYGDNWGESIGEVQEVVATTAERLSDVTTQSLDDISEQILAVSKTWGEDYESVIRSVTQLTQNGLARTSQEALDLIVTGFQDGANEADDLLDTIDEYSQHWGAMGLSGEDALNMIIAGFQGGQRDADKLADAVKEFRIRAVEDTDAITKAYQDLGFDADETREKFLAGGESAREAYLEVLGALRDVEDPIEQNRLAVELIGTQFEDLGPKALDALTTVRGELRETEGAARDLADTVGDVSPWEQAERNAQSLLGGIGDMIAKSKVGQVINAVADSTEALDIVLGDAEDQVEATTEQIDYWTDRMVDASEEAEHHADFLRGDFTQAQQQVEDAIDDATVSFEAHEDQVRETRLAQERYLDSIEHVRDEVGALRREIDDRQAWLALQDTFDATTEKLNDQEATVREQEQAMLDLKEEVLDYAESINLPDSVTTELIALVDAEKLGEVEALLARWGNGITLPIKPIVIGDSGGNARASGQTTNPAGTRIRIDENGNVQSFDTGGVVRGPLGSPQLAVVHGGETILPTHKSGGAALGSITVNIMGGYVDDRTISELERRLDQWRRGAR